MTPQPSFSSLSPSSNRQKTQDSPTPTGSFTSSMTSSVGTLKPFATNNCNSVNGGQSAGTPSNKTTASPPPISFNGQHINSTPR